jgi:hypothetical protein
MLKFAISSVSEYLQHVEIVSHLSRKKMLVQTLMAMIKSRSVVLSELSVHLNDKVKTSSNETRLQDFFREATFDYEAAARFLYSFLQTQKGEKIRLSIDRTEWDFGEQQTNILMVIATKGSYTVPLYWEMLDNKSGNSHTEDRIDIIKKCVEIVGEQNIGLLVGDREFIGHKWFKYLKDKELPFCFRIPKSHLIETVDGQIYNADALWQSRKNMVTKIEFKQCLVDGVWGSARISADAKGDLLFLFGSLKPNFLDQLYKKRWTIETLFHAFKSRGFNLEATHLKFNDRLKKLVAVVSMAYAFCTSLGVFKHEKEKPIKIKNHKRKAKSFFRYGLDFIRDAFKIDYKYELQWLDTFKQFIKFLFANNSFSTT